VRHGLPDCRVEPILPALLRDAAVRFGSVDFVVLPDQRLTFVEADELSSGMAKHLVGAGVGKGTRVAIFLPTGIEWVVAWLA